MPFSDRLAQVKDSRSIENYKTWINKWNKTQDNICKKSQRKIKNSIFNNSAGFR